ncbi:hypothetical protein JW848_05055 [Candidatus Bipolaricaulota bacterium]|nr:hypothetical protein [Candidatus Bipolaricaulota bacterium]
MKLGRTVIAMLALSLTVVLVAAAGTQVSAQTPLDSVEDLLRAASIPSTDRILDAFQFGISANTLTPQDAFLVTDRIIQATGVLADKEAVLLALAMTLEQALPVDWLIDKVVEGISRRVALSAIRFEVQLRAQLQAGVRDLLFSKGIFAGNPSSTGGTALPQQRFNLLVMHISDALGDYREGGGSPLDYLSVYSAVEQRLAYLGGSVILLQDVELALSRVEPAELGQALLGALE